MPDPYPALACAPIGDMTPREALTATAAGIVGGIAALLVLWRTAWRRLEAHR